LSLQALYQIVVLLVLNFAGESILPKQDTRAHSYQVKNTLIFNAFVMCQVSGFLDISLFFVSAEQSFSFIFVCFYSPLFGFELMNPSCSHDHVGYYEARNSEVLSVRDGITNRVYYRKKGSIVNS
jgi:hypothetical protein